MLRMIGIGMFRMLVYSAHLTQWPLWTSIIDWVVPRRSWRHRLPTSVPTTASPTFFFHVQPCRWTTTSLVPRPLRTVDHPHRPGRSLIYLRFNLQSAVTTQIPAASYIPPMIPIGRRTWKCEQRVCECWIDWFFFLWKLKNDHSTRRLPTSN
jgi:hypothetical protein